jgi:protein-S-isoprenylcysteine O-methyltransferase Ste14
MALIEEFEKTGNWLFRRRSFLPLFLYVIATVAVIFRKDEIFDFQNLYWNIGCLAVSLTGLLIRAITIGYAPRGTSGRNTSEGQIAETLNVTGIYSIVRHPLYLGNFFMWFGLIMYVGIVWFIIFGIAFFWVYYERIMFAEEQFIRGKFGEPFMNWAARTPAFIPDFRLWKRSEMTFSLRNVLKREYSGFFGNMISFVYINFIKNCFSNGQVWLDLKWQIGGLAALLIYLTLRSMKKYTRLLNVEGR